MNIRISATLWLVSIILLYYLLKEISVFYLIVGYIMFAISCIRERSFDWQSVFAFGIAWCVGGIAGLISIGVLGFLLRLVGPLPTLLVFIICSLSFIILGMTYAFARIKLQPDIKTPHVLRIGLVVFLCVLVIGIPAYALIMNRLVGISMPRESLKENIDNFWSYMNTINPASSRYMEDLIKRQQIAYEQLRARYDQPSPSWLSRTWKVLTDEILTERFEYSQFVLRMVIEDAMVKLLIKNADLGAKAVEVMSEEQRSEWLMSLDRDVNDYLQRTGGRRIYPKGRTTDLESAFDLGYSPLADWSFKQAVKSTNLWAFFSDIVSISQKTIAEGVTFVSPVQEYSLIQTYDARSRFIALLALANSVILQDSVRACEQGFCDDAVTFDRYFLQPGCFEWLSQNRPGVCQQHIDEKSWLCEIHLPDADCQRRHALYQQT
jgi:hypothetical protein